MSASRAAMAQDCRPCKNGKSLVFPYIVHNLDEADAYVMDCLASGAPLDPAAKPNPQAAVVLHGPGDDVTLGKFIAPSPIDRRIAMPVISLARYLPRGGTLEALLEIPIPLAETSPYFADLPLWQYDVVDISGLLLSIGYRTVGIDGLAALPLKDAPELFTVVTRNTVHSARVMY